MSQVGFPTLSWDTPEGAAQGPILTKFSKRSPVPGERRSWFDKKPNKNHHS